MQQILQQELQNAEEQVGKMWGNKKKLSIGNGTCIWISEIGLITPRIFTVLDEDKEKGNILISFSPNETYWIKKSNIRAKRIIIYKKSDGKIVSQNPNNLGKMNLNAMGIKTLRFNLQNSSLQESRSAIHRWTIPKDVVDKLGPIFKLMFICIAIGVMGWAALKFGGLALDAIMKSRLMDCKELFTITPNPIGTVINGTVPLGAQ
jgi:hypothetical protein